MVFNVMVHNRDDHIKNFAFRLDDTSGEWSLAPAYDLTYATGPGGEHSMTIAGEGKAPTVAHMLQLSDGASIVTRQAHTMIEEVRAAVDRWPSYALDLGLADAQLPTLHPVV